MAHPMNNNQLALKREKRIMAQAEHYPKQEAKRMARLEFNKNRNIKTNVAMVACYKAFDAGTPLIYLRLQSKLLIRYRGIVSKIGTDAGDALITAGELYLNILEDLKIEP